MSRTASTDIVMAAFAAAGRCDERRLAELYHHEAAFRWPPALPYGGSYHGAVALQAGDRTGFDQIWDPLQPTWHKRLMYAGGRRDRPGGRRALAPAPPAGERRTDVAAGSSAGSLPRPEGTEPLRFFGGRSARAVR
jgi:hypothetical protein